MVYNTVEIVAKNISQKSSDVQSGPSEDINCGFVVGREDKTLETSGFIVKKLAMQFLDSWSAVMFTSSRYMISCQGNVKICHKNHKQHRSCITIRSFDDPLLIASLYCHTGSVQTTE